MFKEDVLEHFEHSPAKVGRAIGLTRSAVNQWKKIIPLKQALKLEAATGGALKVDMGAYNLPERPPLQHDLRA